MKSVFHFLLDLVYDWDNVESYEYLVPGIDDEPVDVLDIIDDFIDSTDPVALPGVHRESNVLKDRVNDLYSDGVEFVRSVDKFSQESIEFIESGIPLSRGGGPGFENLDDSVERAFEFLDEHEQWSIDPRRNPYWD